MEIKRGSDKCSKLMLVIWNFRYVSIVQREGLEISQPALDPVKSSELHHQITARGRKIVHR